MKTTKIWDVDHVRPEVAEQVKTQQPDVEVMEPAVQADAIK